MVSTRLWFASIYNQRKLKMWHCNPADKKNIATDEVLRCCDIATVVDERLMLSACLPRARGISEGDLMKLS